LELQFGIKKNAEFMLISNSLMPAFRNAHKKLKAKKNEKMHKNENTQKIMLFYTHIDIFHENIFWIIIAFFANFKWKCKKCAFSNISQKVKRYFFANIFLSPFDSHKV
jgi:hypothetical protein